MLKNKKWIVLQNDNEKVLQISKKYNISSLVASVILNRGITTDEEIKEYIQKTDSVFFDPFLMTDMEKAVRCIKNSVKSGKKTAIYGDYDVDGITATYIMYDYLQSIGANVMYYIPDRADEGYGINMDAVKHLKSLGVELIITVDVGITAVEETAFAKENGIDVIITDHHTPKDVLPSCVAVVNPKTKGNSYPNTELAGVGVAYKLVCALSDGSREIMKKYSEAAAIGTIADMVALKGENRFIAAYGLENLKSSENTGISALMEVSGIAKSLVTSSNISFGLAPRLNAAGRVSSAKISVDLFLEKSKDRAEEIAQMLDEANRIRQNEEHKILEEADEIIKKEKLYENSVIVVAKENWHHGVIGIVSSKITEKYYRPSAVISINEDGNAKASGRSIAGFNLFDALSHCSDTLTKFGGHDLAAGFSLEKNNIAAFSKSINKYAQDIMNDDILTPKIVIDAVISPSDITISTASELSILEPFGIGNKVPVFAVEDAKVTSVRNHKSGKHTFLTLEKSTERFDAPCFNMAENAGTLSPTEHISIAGMLNINSFRGVDSVQFVIRDIKKCDSSIINADSLRCLFVCIRDYVTKNRFKFKFDELKSKLSEVGCSLGTTKIKTAFDIFSELELVIAELEGDTICIKRGKNFYSKCNLEDSEIYNREIQGLKE